MRHAYTLLVFGTSVHQNPLHCNALAHADPSLNTTSPSTHPSHTHRHHSSQQNQQVRRQRHALGRLFRRFGLDQFKMSRYILQHRQALFTAAFKGAEKRDAAAAAAAAEAAAVAAAAGIKGGGGRK